jgi:uncharacterized protein
VYGTGTAKDPVLGVSWFQKAADRGLATAQHYLGVAYLRGTGIAIDSAAGYQWMYLAVKRDPENKDYQARLAAVEGRIRAEPMARGKALAAEWLKRRGE